MVRFGGVGGYPRFTREEHIAPLRQRDRRRIGMPLIPAPTSWPTELFRRTDYARALHVPRWPPLPMAMWPAIRRHTYNIDIAHVAAGPAPTWPTELFERHAGFIEQMRRPSWHEARPTQVESKKRSQPPPVPVVEGAAVWEDCEGTEFDHDTADYTGVTFYLAALLMTDHAGRVAQARLRNVTDNTVWNGAAWVGLDTELNMVSTLSLTLDLQISAAFTFASGAKTYRFQVGGVPGGHYHIEAADILSKV